MPEFRPRGMKMPETKEQFYYMAELYEKALLREQELNSYYRARINRLEQKLGANQ